MTGTTDWGILCIHLLRLTFTSSVQSVEVTKPPDCPSQSFLSFTHELSAVTAAARIIANEYPLVERWSSVFGHHNVRGVRQSAKGVVWRAVWGMAGGQINALSARRQSKNPCDSGMLLLLRSLCFALGVAHVAATYLPPVLPKEYSISFRESYTALSLEPSRQGAVFDSQVSVGTQFWSLAQLSQRAVVSGGVGVGSALPTEAMVRTTVTNFTDTSARGSLVVDLLTRSCAFTANEGGAGYQGYDFFRTFVQGALAAGVPVRQINVTDWVHGGEHFGPACTWVGTPPTGDPQRVLTYTIVYAQGTNHLISYQVNGTEKLPNTATGEPERVSVHTVNMRSDYTETAAWPDGMFDPATACPWPALPRALP
jgi:hypothetical protein